MTQQHIQTIATELSIAPRAVDATAALLAEGATVPFVARYRKEATGGLDEVAITSIRDRLKQLHELDERRAAILKSLQERELLTDELHQRIVQAPSMTILEDIYLPYRPKRRTRATIARERGLQPLADLLLRQDGTDIMAAAEAHVNPEVGVESVEDALAGARDIIAETISEDEQVRARMRGAYAKKAIITSTVIRDMEQEGAKYRDYFDWREPLAEAPSHRILAMRRGEREGVLALSVTIDEQTAMDILVDAFVTGSGKASEQVRMAAEDGYRRLLGPAMETEMRNDSKLRADDEAIAVFAANLRELLMAAPLGQKPVMAIDPGFRTGCKIVCLDSSGKLLHNDTVYLGQSARREQEAAATIVALSERFQVEIIAVGNGTGGRETEAFVRALDFGRTIPVVMVNESGASVYSASEVARDEFPEHDVTVRGSVSIGRRLMDPLAELVKIDPKSIGVGQYQHDVEQKRLREALDDVVISCVNAVGVDVNTASKQLLTYVSGLGETLAANIIEHRNNSGPFASRSQLLKVKRLGPKAYEQAAGFLRIRGADNPLDAGAVHPESYPVVEAMAGDAKCSVSDLMRDAVRRARIRLEDYVSEQVGMPTLTDIMQELEKPGRDPREQFEPFSFTEGVNSIEDVRPGTKLPGIVTNVTAFGAFVDIGVHQDGLVHISQLSDRFVKNPADVVHVQQQVSVTVLSVDLERNRISLSMKSSPQLPPKG